jgi:membrane-bound lytic murein transglycosylase B
MTMGSADARPTLVALAAVVLFAAPALAVTPASPSKKAPAFDPAVLATWTLSAKLGKESPLRAALLEELEAPAQGSEETPLTRAEAEALLDDPRAQLVYGEKTVAIVAPSMVQKHKGEHVDLLKIFLKPERVTKAVAFTREKHDVLARAEERHGVDPAVVVSILMWESRLGAVTGDFLAFNVFTSQAFFIDEANQLALSGKGPLGEKEKGLLAPDRQAERVEKIRARARKNLLALVRLSKGRSMDPLSVKGSWAGALGFPQFMPASLRFAEDGDGDGKVDLFTMDDSIASIARYLAAHGFKEDRRKAVWAYNHEDAYVAGVLAFAEAVKKESAAPSPRPTPPAKERPVPLPRGEGTPASPPR